MMKYFGLIAREFVMRACKRAAKWEDTSEKQQREYLRRHPRSERRFHSQGGSMSGDMWKRRYELEAMRLKKYREIRDWVEENRPYSEVDDRLVSTLYDKMKLEYIKRSDDLRELGGDTYQKLVEEYEGRVRDAGVDASELERLYGRYEGVDIRGVSAEDFKDRVKRENVENEEYERLLLSMRRFVGRRDSSVDDIDFVRNEYGDILDGELGEKVGDLMQMGIDDVGSVREGVRIPGTNEYVGEVDVVKLWAMYMRALRHDSMKPWEKEVRDRIEREGIENPMPFGKYGPEKKGWSAQRVMREDPGYAEWLVGKIVEKRGEQKTPFDDWFLREYMSERVL